MTKLIITVDTEVCVYDRTVDTPDTQIRGRTAGGSAYGIGYMMDCLAARGWSCTFFLNVYDTEVWGDDAVREVAAEIAGRGFDLQLHTHVGGPSGMAGLPVDEQRRLLREGCDRLERWTGKRPRWHRAGNLCANQDTLRACAAEGFTGDSSFLYGWSQCAALAQRPFSHEPGRRSPTGTAASMPAEALAKVGPLAAAARKGLRALPGYGAQASQDMTVRPALRNDLCLQEGILELPITTFRTLPLLHNYRHLDIDACTRRELVSIVRQAARQDLPHVVLLMHSFSLVRRIGRDYVPNGENIKVFQEFLDTMAKDGTVEVSTVASIGPATEGRPTNRRELCSGLVLTYHRSWRHWSRGRKNRVFSLLPLILAAIGVVVYVLWPGP